MGHSKEDESTVVIERIIEERVADGRKVYIVKLEDKPEWRQIFKKYLKNLEDPSALELIQNYEMEQKFIRKINQEYFSDHPVRRLFGFSRGIAPVKVVKIILLEGIMLCEMRWENEAQDFVSYHETRYKCPQLVIAYFQKLMEFEKPVTVTTVLQPRKK